MQIQKPVLYLNSSKLPKDVEVVDAFTVALKELFFVDHPTIKKGTPQGDESFKTFIENQDVVPVWVYYPWRKIAVKMIPEDQYFKLRTVRNKHLITPEEQQNYRNAIIGFAGLSMGSALLYALVQSGGPKTIKLADFDTIELTNLNRLRASVLDIGMNKTLVAARNVWEIDPFADLDLWEKGVSRESVEKFLGGQPVLTIFIDAMDSLDLKVLSRFLCKKYKIPVIMATDIGDTVLLDIERFDLEPERELFHGRIGKVRLEDFDHMDPKKWMQLASKIIGPEYMPEHLQNSVLEVGKSIDAVPRLGTTGSLAGSIVSFAIRRIVNHQELPSGRYMFSMEEMLIPGYIEEASRQQREEKTKAFKKVLGL